MKKYGYLKIVLDDHLGGGLEYQKNVLEQQAEKIGLTAEFIEMELKEGEE